MIPSSKSYSDEALVALGVAAQLVGVSRTTMRKYADDGLVPVYRTPSGQRRFQVSDLRALITREPAPASQKAAS
jgi:excisionase family DNA binding protein